MVILPLLKGGNKLILRVFGWLPLALKPIAATMTGGNRVILIASAIKNIGTSGIALVFIRRNKNLIRFGLVH